MALTPVTGVPLGMDTRPASGQQDSPHQSCGKDQGSGALVNSVGFALCFDTVSAGVGLGDT